MSDAEWAELVATRESTNNFSHDSMAEGDVGEVILILNGDSMLLLRWLTNRGQ